MLFLAIFIRLRFQFVDRPIELTATAINAHLHTHTVFIFYQLLKQNQKFHVAVMGLVTSFNSLLKNDVPTEPIDTKTWRELWGDYLTEARHFSSRQKEDIFGHPYLELSVLYSLMERYTGENIIIPYDFSLREKLYATAFEELKDYMIETDVR